MNSDKFTLCNCAFMISDWENRKTKTKIKKSISGKESPGAETGPVRIELTTLGLRELRATGCDNGPAC